MPKPNVIFDAYAMDSLKSAIANKLGFAVMNKADCVILSDAIRKSGKAYISSSTVFRLLFHHKDYLPYRSTLDIVCVFLGYISAAHFQEHLEPQRNFLISSGIDVNKNSKSLLFYCVENNCKKPLHQFFDNLQEENDVFNWGVGISLYDDLLKTTRQVDFFKNFGGNLFVRTFLLEKLHDPRFRFREYETAYVNYLKQTPKKDDIHHLQDTLFGKAVLFRYYFLTGNHRKAANMGKQIYQKGIHADKMKDEIYIFPLIRYMAYRIWYMEIVSYAPNDIFKSAMDLVHQAKQMIRNRDESERDMILHTIAEVILHSYIRVRIEPEFKRTFKKELSVKSPYLTDTPMADFLRFFDRNALIHNRP